MVKKSFGSFFAPAVKAGSAAHPPVGIELEQRIQELLHSYKRGFEASFSDIEGADVAIRAEGKLHPRYANEGAGQVVEVGPLQLVKTLLSPGASIGRASDLQSGDVATVVDYCMQRNGNNGGKEGSAAFVGAAWTKPMPNPNGDPAIAAYNEKIDRAAMDVDAWQLMYTRPDNTLGFRPVIPSGMEPGMTMPETPDQLDIQRTVLEIIADNPGMTQANFTHPVDTVIAMHSA